MRAHQLGLAKWMDSSEVQRLLSEDLISFKAAAKLFPTPLTTRTLQRYAKLGVKCHISNRKIRLEAIRADARSYETSRQAVQRFLERINGVSE